MTCQECELALGLDQDAEEHLVSCASCRSLAEEMRANRTAFESLATEPVPEVHTRVLASIRRRSIARHVAGWIGAAAAAAMIAIALRPMPPEEVMPPVRIAHVPPAVFPAKTAVSRVTRYRAKKPPLMMKILTDDPDVVIYWQVESEDEK